MPDSGGNKQTWKMGRGLIITCLALCLAANISYEESILQIPGNVFGLKRTGRLIRRPYYQINKKTHHPLLPKYPNTLVSRPQKQKIQQKQFVVRPRPPLLPFRLTPAAFLIPAIPTLVGMFYYIEHSLNIFTA